MTRKDFALIAHLVRTFDLKGCTSPQVAQEMLAEHFKEGLERERSEERTRQYQRHSERHIEADWWERPIIRYRGTACFDAGKFMDACRIVAPEEIDT